MLNFCFSGRWQLQLILALDVTQLSNPALKVNLYIHQIEQEVVGVTLIELWRW